MATLLVRYIYKKYKARRAVNDQTEESSGPSTNQPQASATGGNVAEMTPLAQRQTENIPPDTRNAKSGLKWMLTLMFALLIPIFLETLDYTGE